MRPFRGGEVDEGETWEGAPTWSWAFRGGEKWFSFLYGGLEYTRQADNSTVQLTLAGGDVLNFAGYSTTCQVLGRLAEGETQSDDYEAAVLDTVGWRAKELHSMICIERGTEQVIGFAAPDAGKLDKVTAVFIAEPT